MDVISSRSGSIATHNQHVRVRAIRTGSVRIRSNQVQGKGRGLMRQLRTYTGVAWSEWLPIHAWVIDHPEGVIVVDTGETARISEPGYFPWWHPYFRRGVAEQVNKDNEIGSQLSNDWFDPNQVRKVVLTHLHTDHAGGLHDFPNSEILIGADEYAMATGPLGRIRGYLPNRFPSWLKPTLITFDAMPIGPFPRSLSLTEAGDIVAVPTPGHTPGHLSIIVRTPDVTYFLAGDTSYTEQLMLNGMVDGVASNDDAARDTLRRIQEFAAQEPLVYLPTHDPESQDRLEHNQVVAIGTGRCGNRQEFSKTE